MPSSSRSKITRYILSTQFQMIVGFIIPTIVLLVLSASSRLGPLNAMFLALAFPVVLEIYSIGVRRKPSLLSILAIGGILFIGAISFFKLSEEWLAVRRSGLYIVAAIVILVAIKFRRSFVERLLSHIIDLPGIKAAAMKRQHSQKVDELIGRAFLFFAFFLFLIGIGSYLLTVIFMTAPTGTAEFNAQYAELRLISLGAITVPFIIGVTLLLTYLMNGLEKYSGISMEKMVKKKSEKQ